MKLVRGIFPCLPAFIKKVKGLRSWPWIRLIILVGALLLAGLDAEDRRPLAFLHQGDAHRARKEYWLARQSYWQAGLFRPRSPLPSLGVGEVYLEQKRYPLAVGALTLAVRLAHAGTLPEQQARLGLAEAYAGLGNYPKATILLHRILALDPENIEARCQLGKFHIATADFTKAQEEFETILASFPDEPRAHYYLGLLLALKEPGEAASHLEKAATAEAGEMLKALRKARTEEDEAQAAAIIGSACFNLEEWTLARRAFEEALRIRPDFPEAHAYLGRTLARLGDEKTALRHLRRAVYLAPNYALGRYFLGMFHRQQGRIVPARIQFRRVLELDPENAAICVEMARTYIDERNYPKAENWLNRAVELEPGKAEFYLILAHFHLDLLFAPEKGLEAARRAVELEPENAAAHDLLGWAYYLLGKRTEAEMALKEALRLNPDLPSVHYHLGALFAWRGVLHKALYEYQRAIDLDPEGLYGQRAQEMIQELERGR